MGTDGGGLTLTAARTTVFKSFGDSTTITAALAVPAAGTNLLINTTLGELSQLDGGSAGTSLTATTDSAGQAQVRFAETGVGGLATITAMAAGGSVSGSTTVRVLEVANVQHTTTQCGSTTNCSVMGIRNSGFNETALVRFRVSDNTNQPVADIQVSFSLNNAPAGVTVTPSATTNAMGIAEASVQSGLVVGSFTVTASVGGGALTANSPTIGVRGAKPSNQGFTMQCAKTNLATYVAPTPPLGITVACTITLVDRFGNPVGRVTSVNLNSEAGALPPTIMTTGYSPTGSNMNEGKGMLNLSTVGPFPALDVTPLPADSAQYPFPRLAEPSTMDGALTRNPRDGLVTILAYTDGEEHYYDDNSNGMRDSNERFIDQGEPFTDANDNNQWDPGEFYNDVDGSGGWTPANGTWDANAKVWTVAHVLYTDASRGSLAQFSPSSFTVGKGTQQFVDVYMPDLNLNHLEAGAGAAAARAASKGQIALVNLNLALDGFGFAFEARRLVNAAGTGPCDPTTPICSFRTLFGDWGRGYIGQLRLTGAATTDMTPAAPDTITVTTTVRGVAGAAAVSGTFQ
ncbi:MAG: Ig-like domain-containing protein [Myxococcales bacterium]|nr:Ig-like domain-containing protein [Myxococcales bacterium]